MNSVRVRFIRGEKVKFISHLDLMKVFERAIRRSGLPIAYSQGFNPHPQMVFGLPLSVGVTSESEYADFELAEPVELTEFMDKVNGELPGDIEIIDARNKASKGNIMASVSGAVYEIRFFLKEKLDIHFLQQKADSFLKKDEVLVKKEGKGGIREVNIRPMIYSLDLYTINTMPEGYGEFGSRFCMSALLSAGSVSNIKPELLLSAFAEQAEIRIAASMIHRKELFIGLDGKMVDPMNEKCLVTL